VCSSDLAGQRERYREVTREHAEVTRMVTGYLTGK
jgi:hypothetical protein